MSIPKPPHRKIAVIGGGAAGFFVAINTAEKNPSDEVIILEKTGKILQKVKISGGGRCNVTNACFYPRELIKNYPRGGKQLLPLFHIFQPRDTMEWFSEKGVEIKIEEDNRAFPKSDNSQSIIDCFVKSATNCGVKVMLHHDVSQIRRYGENDFVKWKLWFKDRAEEEFDIVIVTTGSVPSMWRILADLGHTIIPPVPSLFTFNIDDPRIKGLQGVAFDQVKCRMAGGKTETEGPMLVTHWGLSGPAILKLSAFAARELSEKKYKFKLSINFSPEMNFDSVRDKILETRSLHFKKLIKNTQPISMPSRYWKSILQFCEISEDLKWQDASKRQINKIAEEISNAVFDVIGKSTFKEEFVTCGGVDLYEVNMNTMESKLFPRLYFAGEALNIDAVTGGFNFQSAWTTAWVVSEALNPKNK